MHLYKTIYRVLIKPRRYEIEHGFFQLFFLVRQANLTARRTSRLCLYIRDGWCMGLLHHRVAARRQGTASLLSPKNDLAKDRRHDSDRFLAEGHIVHDVEPEPSAGLACRTRMDVGDEREVEKVQREVVFCLQEPIC